MEADIAVKTEGQSRNDAIDGLNRADNDAPPKHDF